MSMLDGDIAREDQGDRRRRRRQRREPDDRGESAASSSLLGIHRSPGALERKAAQSAAAGREITRGLGAGADPEVGRKAALEDTEKILEMLDGADMILFDAGMVVDGHRRAADPGLARGGDRGVDRRGGDEVIESFERPAAMQIAEREIEELRDSVDTLITIPETSGCSPSSSAGRCWPKPSGSLMISAAGRAGSRPDRPCLARSTSISPTFGRSCPERAWHHGRTGTSRGEEPGAQLRSARISSPLLEVDLDRRREGRADQRLGGRDLTLHEVAEAARIIQGAVDPDAEHHHRDGDRREPRRRDEGHRDRDRTLLCDRESPSGGGRRRDAAAERRQRAAAVGPRTPASAWVAPRAGPLAAEPKREKRRRPRSPSIARCWRGPSGDDPGGFGPNWSDVDDYDIPTVLRKQMD